MQLETMLDARETENGSYKDAWAISARPQIQQLMAGSPDNHIAAMTLLIPWMDQVYTRDSGQSSKGKTRQVVSHFFPDAAGYELGRLTGFIVDLKHIGYAGKKTALLDAVLTVNLMGSVEVRHEQRLAQPYTLVDDTLLVHPTAFVEHVRTRIDQALAGEMAMAGASLSPLE